MGSTPRRTGDFVGLSAYVGGTLGVTCSGVRKGVRCNTGFQEGQGRHSVRLPTGREGARAELPCRGPLPSLSEQTQKSLMPQIHRLTTQQPPSNKSHMKETFPEFCSPPSAPGTQPGPSDPLLGTTILRGAEHPGMWGLSEMPVQEACSAGFWASAWECPPAPVIHPVIFWSHCREQEPRTDSRSPSLSRVSASQ